MVKPLTMREQIGRIFTVLLGVPGTDDGGAVQDIKGIEKHLAKLNSSVSANTAWRKALTWVVGIIITGMFVFLAYLLRT